MSIIDLEIQGHKFEVKPWNYGEKQAVLRKITKRVKKKDGQEGELGADIDPWSLNDHMVITCVKKWDLVHPETKELLPISVESLSVVRPPEIIEELIDEIQAINGVSKEEKKKSSRP